MLLFSTLFTEALGSVSRWQLGLMHVLDTGQGAPERLLPASHCHSCTATGVADVPQAELLGTDCPCWLLPGKPPWEDCLGLHLTACVFFVCRRDPMSHMRRGPTPAAARGCTLLPHYPISTGQRSWMGMAPADLVLWAPQGA